jgi:hypothetical protein
MIENTPGTVTMIVVAAEIVVDDSATATVAVTRKSLSRKSPRTMY